MLLEVTNLSGGYGHGDIVKEVNFSVDAGDILCLVGPNGCGKTTLFRLLLGVLSPTGGQIFIDGADTQNLKPKALSKLIAYIPQYHTPVFSYSALDVVIMGRVSHLSAFDTPRTADRDAAFSALEKLGVAHLATHRFDSLSGGQRQLILIARAICQDAKILVMDEPAANLDYANHQLLTEVLSDLSQNGYCIIMSTHSPEHPASLKSKVLMMKDGGVAAFGDAEKVITPKNLQTVYGIEMDVVSAMDRYGCKRTICLPVKHPSAATSSETINLWNKRADSWESSRLKEKKTDDRVEDAVEFLTAKGLLLPEHRVADIGCGPGRFASAFAEKVRCVDGFDISEKMIQYGTEHIERHGIHNAFLHTCDFETLDIRKSGYEGAFDLVFSSLTPAVRDMESLQKSIAMSRGWCLNITHLSEHSSLEQQISRDVFQRAPAPRWNEDWFHSLFQMLHSLGYCPETSYYHRHQEKLLAADDHLAQQLTRRLLSEEEQTKENQERIRNWLNTHKSANGTVENIIDTCFGRTLWNVNSLK